MTSTTMGLAEKYSIARAEEAFSIDYESSAMYEVRIDDRQKARAALEQRIKELERDAKRYRWLREQNEILASDTFYVGFDDQDEPDDIGWVGSDLDSVVDHAMSEAALTKLVDVSQEYKLP